MSDEHNSAELIQRALDSLKDFQRATVDVVYDNLFRKGQQRMLVADEVGLGKTIVAKGVIARCIRDRLVGGGELPLKVTYICSNQVIAHENVGKLDIFPDKRSHDRFASRLSYLAFQPEESQGNVLRLNTLTPATSFNKGSSTGQQGERRIIYSLLMQDDQLNSFGKSISAILRAGVQKLPSEWFTELDSQRDTPCGYPLRPCCSSRFTAALKAKVLPYSQSPLFDTLELKRPISLYAATKNLSELVTLKNLGQFRAESDQLVTELKDVLSEVCVNYIDADIYILDEFQRFKELVTQDVESDAAEIARRIFSKQDARILLLSATPFKAYTGDAPWESGEEHYKEFRSILSFLFNGDKDAISKYDHHRQSLFKQLIELGSNNNEIDSVHRDEVQQVLRRVMCRTERLSVSEDFNAMTVDKWRTQPLQVTAGDIQNFIATDNVVRCLNDTGDTSQRSLHAPVEFCKSAPFPLSFLDDYKIKSQLSSRKDEPEVRRQLELNRSAWINHGEVNKYELLFQDGANAAQNSKFSQVLEEVTANNGELLLWVPPSLPCYPLTGPFSKASGFSKTLIFSSWLMVPRMISSLISYEVERRTIGHAETMDSQEQKERKYFHGKNERRHPIPQLTFSQKKSDAGESPNNMSNFALLYPSQTLADLLDCDSVRLGGNSLQAIRENLVAKLNGLIEDAELHKFGTPTGESDRWYWAAPLLLDRRTPSNRNRLDDWLTTVLQSSDSTFFGASVDGSERKEESSSKEKHFQEFVNCFSHPNKAGLGILPPDLADVLADIAIASPAVTSLRSIEKCFEAPYYDRVLFAFDLAAEFLTLFNKPESIAAIRLSTSKDSYWKRVLNYCESGCLQSVLDEFFHVLRPDAPTIWDMFERVIDSMNLGTSSIKVDDLKSFLSEKRRNMRCHYAVDLGNQRIETEDGRNRIKGIRYNFNSPFRPFVLATTSIGQEGLDFHTYCRKIVHWNLPTNPIDLEQREGRINRFKGLVIRQQIAAKYGSQLTKELIDQHGLWNALFAIADHHERVGTGKCELIPYWHVVADLYQIERIIPFYPFSKDRAKLTSLLKTLALYRLAFGQPRQAELVEHLLTNVPEARISELRSKLMIDLSPINYRVQSTAAQNNLEQQNNLETSIHGDT